MQYELGGIFVFSLLAVWIVRKKAYFLGLIDTPNERSVHKTHTPRGAGIAFYLAVMCITPFFHLDLLLNHVWITLAIFMVFVIGLLDDHHDAAPRIKFIVIIIATIFLYFDGLVIDDIGTFFGFDISLSWFALLFTIFAVSGLTNALNLIDGLDGLAGTISMIILGSFFAIGYVSHDIFIMTLSSTFFVSVWAFLFYNWHPASIFMGDSGSLTLGFVISVLSIKSLDYVSTVSILFIVAIPIFDTIIVMFRRKLSGTSAFKADAYHMHHLLKNFFQGSTQKTVLFLAMLQLIYSLTALQFSKKIDEGLLLVLFVLNIIVLYILLNRMKKNQANED